MNPFFKKSFKIATALFAVVGLFFVIVFFGMQFGLFNVRGSIASRNISISGTKNIPPLFVNPCIDAAEKTCDWNNTSEWAVVKGGLTKDADTIKRAGNETGVGARMIAAVVVPEQTRFFTANREVFKRYFEPLKILGSLSQFSLGVSGIKEATAVKIEAYAADPTSPFYPGTDFTALFAYPPEANHDTELYNRLTDAKNHYYQYLYTALYIKEIESSWQKSGYDITQNPEAVVTLFNLGFQASHPNANPQAGGAPITTGGEVYAYGELGALFYHSSELSDIFPQS